MSDDRDHQGRDRRRFRIAGTGERSSVSTLGPMGHVDDLVAAYALGALEPEESASVDAHVRACVACEHALVDAQSVAGMLFLHGTQSCPTGSHKGGIVCTRGADATGRRGGFAADAVTRYLANADHPSLGCPGRHAKGPGRSPIGCRHFREARQSLARFPFLSFAAPLWPSWQPGSGACNFATV